MADGPQIVRTLALAIDSRLEEVLLVSLAVRGICRYTLKDDEVPGQMELSVVEAVNNAIKHAYDGQAGNEVRVTVVLYGDHIVFGVSDSGRAMSTANQPEPKIDPEDRDSLPESGMGLLIIRSAMDQVDYRSEGGWNTLTMTKYFHNHL